MPNTYRPDSGTPPGDTLLEIIASRCKLDSARVYAIVAEHAPITAADAEMIGSVIGPTADFWLNRERLYRESVRPTAALTDAELARIEAQWATARHHSPTRDMDNRDNRLAHALTLQADLDVARLTAALRRARGLVAALAGPNLRDSRNDCWWCHAQLAYGEPHKPDCDLNYARVALAAWAGEEVEDDDASE